MLRPSFLHGARLTQLPPPSQGVIEYWIIDTERCVLEQYLQEDNGLALKKKSDSGIVESRAIPGFAIEIAALFDEQKNLEAIRKWLS